VYNIAIIAMFVIFLIPMVGISYAQEYKIFNNTKTAEGKLTYDVQYSSVKTIVSGSVNTKDRSVNFVLVGKTDSNSTLAIKLPLALINPPFIGVWVDNQQIGNFTTIDEQTDTIVKIPITPLSENIGIVGSSVVPEFGPASVIILTISVLVIVIFAKNKFVKLLRLT
jgi:predicted secreted protein with PEFG-CTERM motif